MLPSCSQLCVANSLVYDTVVEDELLYKLQKNVIRLENCRSVVAIGASCLLSLISSN